MFSPAGSPSLRQRRAAGVTATLLRRAVGHFATGVTVVTARPDGGAAYGTTANSVTAVSLDPPLVLVCLQHGSETLAALRASGRFAVNILRADQRALSDRFARKAHAGTWEGVEHRLVDGVPVLEGSLASLECEIHQLVAGGDHAIVIGHVLAADHPDEHVEPLLYYRGAYAALDAAPPPPAPPAVPRRRVDIALPSALGDLRMVALAHDDEDAIRVAVEVGEPRGRRGAVVHLHRGCLLGDAFGSTACAGRAALDAALALMGAETPGVVVYHREAGGVGACCAAAAAGAPAPPTDAELASVRRAVRALNLRDVRLIADPETAALIADVGVPVAEVVAAGAVQGSKRVA